MGGQKGATQFVLYTNWQLPHVRKEHDGVTYRPVPIDLGYHAYEPQYEGQSRMGQCDILTDAPGGCYYDGSSLNAELVFERLLQGGDAGVWNALEEKYRDMFESNQ